MEDIKFIETVKAEMSELLSKGIVNEGDQFAIWFLTKILNEEEGVAIEKYHIGGAGDHKLDIGIFDDDHTAIIIGQCKYTNDPLSGSFSTDVPNEAKNAYDRLRSMPEAGNDKRKEFAKRFNSVSPDDKPIRKLAIGFGRFSGDAFKFASNEHIEIYDFEKIKFRYIYNQILESYPKPEVIKINLQPGKSFGQEVLLDGKKLKNWVFLLNIVHIYDLVKQYKDGIFEANLRYKLEKSAKSGISKGIYDSIISAEEALKFSIMNNGITIVGRVVDDNDFGNNKLTIYDPQIVNGCQTSWAIFDAVKFMTDAGKDPNEIQTSVLVKLIEASDEKLVEQITKSTNRQNPIDMRDMRTKDTHHVYIAAAFKTHAKPIYYNYREGSWESVIRESKQSTYRVSGKVYRKIDNTFAGQLYLALLGKPYWSKQFKQKIFDDVEYYSTIFHCDEDRSVRFNKPNLGLTPEIVSLSSGCEKFKDDVLFAFAVYQLTDALKQKYKKKTDLYSGVTLNESQAAAYKILGRWQFLNSWHFLLVSLIQHIINKTTSEESERLKLREKIIGSDWNLLFNLNSLVDHFKLNNNMDQAPVLDEDNPSDNYLLFYKWVTAIMSKMESKIEPLMNTPEFSFRNYLDQREDTYKEMKEWINEEYARGKTNWQSKFPV